MPFRFRKIISFGKGFRLNFSKRGMSASIGGPGATLNLGKRGIRPTVGIPGTGLSFTPSLSNTTASTSGAASNNTTVNMIVLAVSGIVVCCISIFCLGFIFTDIGTATSTPTIRVDAPLEQIIAMTGDAAQMQTQAFYSPTVQSTSLGTSTFTPTVTMVPASTINSETMNAQATFYNSTPIFTPFIYPTSDGIIVNPPGGGNNNNFDSNGDGKVTCADFQTQPAAQRAYYAGYTNLDGNDNDGKACESLP